MRHVILLAEARPESGASLALPLLAVLACALVGVFVARPLTRRRHARFVGRTAADLQRLIGDTRLGDVLPSRGRRSNGRTPIPRSTLNVVVASLPTRRLVELVGENHPVCGLGRHRRPLAVVSRRRPSTPTGYWQAYLEGIELPVSTTGDGERFFADHTAGAPGGAEAAEPVAPPAVMDPTVSEPVAGPVRAEPAAGELSATEPTPEPAAPAAAFVQGHALVDGADGSAISVEMSAEPFVEISAEPFVGISAEPSVEISAEPSVELAPVPSPDEEDATPSAQAHPLPAPVPVATAEPVGPPEPVDAAEPVETAEFVEAVEAAGPVEAPPDWPAPVRRGLWQRFADAVRPAGRDRAAEPAPDADAVRADDTTGDDTTRDDMTRDDTTRDDTTGDDTTGDDTTGADPSGAAPDAEEPQPATVTVDPVTVDPVAVDAVAVDAVAVAGSFEAGPEPAEDAAPTWYDEAPDGRGRSRRSAVMSRASGGTSDPGGWWHRRPSAAEATPAACEDSPETAGSFWGAAGPRRPVNVVELTTPPSADEVEAALEAAVEAAVEKAAADETVVEEAAVIEGAVIDEGTPRAPVAPVAPGRHTGNEDDPAMDVVEAPADVVVEASSVETSSGTADVAVTERVPEAAPAGPAVPIPRGPRQPSTRQRQVLRRASRRLEAATDRYAIANVACAEARVLVDGHIASLVVRSVEGPRVLRQDPDGTGIWGARTLAALMHLGRPLRKVIDGDPLSGGGQTALLAVPVPAGGSIAGTLIVRRGTGRAFSPAEQGCLERLARMTGTALDAVTRRGILLGEGRVDRVTGLGRRERLLEDLRSALRTAQSHGMPTTLVAVEIAGLAQVRETAGRPVADEAMAGVGAAVAQTLRVGDVAYRFGVDELAVLLPATSEDEAPAVARRLTDAVAALDLRASGLGPIALRTAVVPVVGVAEDVVVHAIRALAAGNSDRSVDA